MYSEHPMISVYCATYNHENYITQALDSILMQKTQYSMEILVGEDCSTDNTRAVLKEYEKQHPGKLKVFYRERNLFVGNFKDLKKRCKGRYIICLEGDDFWTDEYKIEKQVNFLEAHPEYLAVAHNCVVVGEDSKSTGEVYPECKVPEYTMKCYQNDIMPGQTTTLLCRNYVHGNVFDTSFINTSLIPGDRKLYFSLVANGRVYCMQEVMSAYRHVTSSGSSFSATYKYKYENAYNWNLEQLKYAYKINKTEAIKCAELLLALTVQYGLRHHNISFREAIADIVPIRNKCRTFTALVIRNFKRAVQIITNSSPSYLNN